VRLPSSRVCKLLLLEKEKNGIEEKIEKRALQALVLGEALEAYEKESKWGKPCEDGAGFPH
jgi:hypothetical protein